MPYDIPSTLATASAFWVASCALSALLIWRKQVEPLRTEVIFVYVAIGLLALAPVVALVVYGFSGERTFLGGGVHVVLAAVLLVAARRASKAAGNENFLSGMTYREKSAGLTFAALVLVAGNVSWRLWNGPEAGIVGVLIESVVALVIIMIVGHTLIALFHQPLGEIDIPEDERDRALSLQSTRNAAWVLGAGMWTVMIMALFPPLTAVTAPVILGFILLAELVWYGSLFCYYRLGDA